MRRLFFEFLHYDCEPRWWHGHAYYDVRRNCSLKVIYPFHYAVRLAWWLNARWAAHAHAPSWIDRKVSDEVEHELKRRDLL